MLAVDLFVFHREAHEVTSERRPRGASSGWRWRCCSAPACTRSWAARPGLEYFAGYVIEKALSVDNIFVFVLIFGFFRVPARYQHRVLFWGVLGALVMRGAMIAAGAYLIAQFPLDPVRLRRVSRRSPASGMACQKDGDLHPESNPVIRLVRRLHAGHRRTYHGQSFFVHGQSAEWCDLRHTAVRRAGTRRDHRPDLRGRLDSGRFRRHADAVHHLQLERVRDSRSACALFPSRRRHPALPLSEAGAVSGAGVRRT